jgi:environmental stress-induced protein Ves
MDYGVRVLRFADYPVVPWRNGKGITREIAASAVAVARVDADDASPALPSAGPSWRISMATVDDEVPFSSFAGLRRMLGVVGGEGIELTVDGRMRPLRRGETFGPFAGEAPASARPLDGPALDLGLMVDPARVRGDMRSVGAGGHGLVGLIWFVVSLVDGLDLGLNGTPAATLARRDTAALDLRTGPIAELSLAVDAGSRADGGAGSNGDVSPLAYLLSISL